MLLKDYMCLKKHKIYHHETLICSQKIYARYTLIFVRIEEMQNSERQRLYITNTFVHFLYVGICFTLQNDRSMYRRYCVEMI